MDYRRQPPHPSFSQPPPAFANGANGSRNSAFPPPLFDPASSASAPRGAPPSRMLSRDSASHTWRPQSFTEAEPSSGYGTRHSTLGKHGASTIYQDAPGSMSRDMSNSSQPYDNARRSSLGSNGSPPVFSGQLEHSQSSSSTPYASRQMPPPVSPQNYAPRSGSIQPPPPPPPALSSYNSRDPAPPGAPTHRPGSSMSISAMLGSDAERPPRETSSSSSYGRSPLPPIPTTGASPAVGGASSAPSSAHPGGRRSPHPISQGQSSAEFPPFQRSHTPDRHFFSKPPAPQHSHRSGSLGGGPPVPHHSHSSSEDRSQYGALGRTQGASQFGEHHQPQRQYHSHQHSPSNSLHEHATHKQDRRMSLGGPIQRPSSQPHFEDHRSNRGFSPGPRPGAGSGDAPQQRSGGQGYPGMDSQHRYGSTERERYSQEPLGREQEYPAQQHPPPRYGPEPEGERPPQRALWDSSQQRQSPEATRNNETPSNLGFGGIQNYTKSLGSQLAAPRSVPDGPGAGRHGPPRHGQTPPPNDHSATQSHQSHIFSPTARSQSQSFEEQPRGSDEVLPHKSLLNINAESKRGGRVSPLPQAVQGAQAQLMGPTGEAGIKNELGRVFSGIGSGVGVSAAGTSGSGSPTPMTSSPFKKEAGMARSEPGDGADFGTPKPGRNGSGSKRSRKQRSEEARAHSEAGAQGHARRGRHPHHHHHHGHHHHHHRHKPDEEAPPHGLGLPGSTTLRPDGTPDGAVTPLASGAAHHHHHRHHHHHHVPRSTPNAPAPGTTTPAAPGPPPREYTTTVNLEPLLRSVRHLPRSHLGSTLYCPRINVAPSSAPPETAKFGYTTTPTPLPRFEGRENCTYTVRVPRFRIDATHREEICARRALWGTGVYTDDSDPVAAAIHSGFIRGEWGEEVDVTMLDLEIKEGHQHAPQSNQQQQQLPNGSGGKEKENEKEKTNGTKPRTPPVPPPDKDLQITLLILPALKKYDSAVMYGLMSRPWGGNHDGMSFKVERIEWVDEGQAMGQERGGEARRKRLRSMMSSGRIFTVDMKERKERKGKLKRFEGGPDDRAAPTAVDGAEGGVPKETGQVKVVESVSG